MKCEIIQCMIGPGVPCMWRVECDDYEVSFSGTGAEQRARVYAACVTPPEISEPDLVIPKFKPGDICKCKLGIPGIITHHIITNDASTFKQFIV